MNARIIQFPKITDPRGNLTYLQPPVVPFTIARAFWTYDVPGDSTRGGHAYRSQEEIIVALSGSFDVVITEKNGAQHRFAMKRSYYGLVIPALTWRHMENFSTNSFSLHLSSQPYSATEYIRDFSEFAKTES